MLIIAREKGKIKSLCFSVASIALLASGADAAADGFFSFHPAENTNKKTEKAIDLPPFCLYNGR